jgi:hypothetical protein
MHLSLFGLLLVIGCIIHIFRSGAERYWIFVVLFLPGIGPLIYLAVEILPGLFNTRAGWSLARSLRGAPGTGRSIRECQAALELADTTENRRLLAEEYVACGRFDQAIPLYEKTLTGFHADDPALLMGYARACLGHGDAQKALEALDHLTRANPEFDTPERHLFHAKCLEGVGRLDEALEEFRTLAAYAPGEEARCRFALLLRQRGEIDAARAVFAEILAHAKHAPRHYRSTEREWIEIAHRFG